MSTYRRNDTKNKVKNEDNTHRQWKKHQSVMQTILGISNGRTVEAIVETP